MIRRGFRLAARRGSRGAGLAVACAALAAASPACAAPLLFSFTGTFNGSFLLDSNPVVSSFGASTFSADYTNGTGDFPTNANAIFYDPDFNAGFTLTTAPADFKGVILFSGPTGKPHILSGTYTLDAGSTTLTIGPGAPGPEIAGGLFAALAALGALALTRRPRVACRSA